MSNSRYGKTALIDEVASNLTGVTRTQVEQVINATLATIQQHLQAGQAVTITGFGTFQTSQRSARMGTNPQTRQKIQIPARTSARWTPSKGFLGSTKARTAGR